MSTKAIEHVFISNDPLVIGQMSGAQKYKFFASLCVALENIEQGSSTHRTRSNLALIVMRRDLSVKQHWHQMVKPTCDRCLLLQAILRANVKKENRLTYDRDQFRTLMQQIESEQHP